MTFFKWAFLGVIALMATAVSSAQQNFPLRPGEWLVTTPGATPDQPPTIVPFCLNNDLWYKNLTKNPTCAITNYSTTPAGISYNISCSTTYFLMKGKVNIVFDGMTHMVSQGSIDTNIRGTISHSYSQSDYRWKGPTCDPNTDVNLKVSTQTDSEPPPPTVYRNHVDQ
jgi:hypothetical protein